MKVLYVGHYREGSGWSQAAIDYILALDSVGVDVVCRPLKLNNNQPDLPERILQLESKPSKGSTHCIQHVLPHFMDWSSRFEKNIGLFVTETKNIRWAKWPQHLKLMDELWVPNTEMVDVCKDSGIDTPVKIVPHAYNPEKYEYFDEFSIPKLDGKFMFYFIGEMIRRKRISALLRAYYLAFDKNDDVGLVIKTNKGGLSGQQVMEELSQTDRAVRENMRLYPDDRNYPDIAFICDRISDQAINGLHRRGDCFVTATFGDAWCIPAFDALAQGNSVIAPCVGGMKDYLSLDLQDGCSEGENTALVAGMPTHVFGADQILPDLGTARETWFEVNIPCLINAMQAKYIFRGVKRREINLSQYNYENIGKLMATLLEDK